MHPGPGFGGSCFPKDIRALAEIGKKYKARTKIIESVININERRKLNMVKKVQDSVGNLKDKTISVLGLTFKPNTDDMRESPSLTIVSELLKLCKKVKVYDPAGMNNAKSMKQFKGVKWSKNTYDCIKDSDAMVLVTEWNEFRALDLKKVKNLLKQPIVIDLRNIYSKEFMQEVGINYIGVGRN